ncbi:inner membrane yedI domain protein, partial [Acinetobacter sp. 1566109]
NVPLLINHTIPLLHHITDSTVDHVENIPAVGNIIGALTPTLMNFAIGMIAGAVVLLVVSLIQKMWPKASD